MSVLAPAAGAWFLHDVDLLHKHADALTEEEFRYVVECNQPPVAVGSMISRHLRMSQLHQFERIAIEDELGQFMNTLGSLNRLTTMPIYLSYSRNCVRMTMWFLFGLPFALWASMSWMTLVAVLATTVLLASIENIGTQIEQPLLVLPVETIVSNTRRHVEATIDSVVSLDGTRALLYS
jgi:predicted membrane chloride channel (bestrophin family)